MTALLSAEVGRDVPSSEAFAVLMAVLTSSVSAKIRPHLTAALSGASVRLSTCVIGPGRTDW
jgi:hypothetical protein